MGWSLGELVAAHDVPGAQVAVLVDGEIQDEAAGVLSPQVETTSDSVFRIGSITKVWTATLVQQLADEGLLDLDRPVRDHLPGFRLSDPDATAALTARQLLTHTGGIDSNHFTDAGVGDDAVATFVDVLADADQLLPPGTVFSYSNSGFAVLARLVEVVRGKYFHDVLRERLVVPLGLRTVATDEYWGRAPGGSHLTMSARELMAFIRLHLTDPALAVLREPQLDSVPDFGGGVVGWGLGWMRYPDGVVGHTGVAKGHKAFLRVVPSEGVAVAVLTNGARAEALAYEVFGEFGVEAALSVPPANPGPIDVDRMCGTYRSTLYDVTLTVENDRAFLLHRPRNELALSFLGKEEDRVEVVRLGDSSIITVEPKADGYQVMSLVGSDAHGRARFLHNGAAAERIT